MIALDHFHRRAQAEEEFVLAGEAGRRADARPEHEKGQQEEQQALAGGVTEGGGQMHGGEFYPASACPLPLKLSDRCSWACVSA